MGSDYEELKKALEELEEAKQRAIEASEAKGRFLSQISHEIRTPVNAILGYNELVLQDTGEVATREYAAKVKSAANRLMDFFDAVIDYVAGSGDDVATGAIPSMDILSDERDDKPKQTVTVRKKMEITGAYKYRVLVVDDTEVNVDLLARMLRPTGLSVDSADNGQKAISLIKKHHYDLIFMDHMMPIMDGIEALREMRINHLCDDTPVIMLTANAIEGEKEKYLNEGFAAYIAKPFSEEAIYEALQRFLNLDAKEMEIPDAYATWEDVSTNYPFLDIDTAKKYCMDTLELFVTMVREFRGLPVDLHLIETCKRKNWHDYKRSLLGLYNGALIIGATELVEHAGEIIRQLDSMTADEIKRENEALIVELYELRNALAPKNDQASHTVDQRPLVLVIDDEKPIHTLVEGILGTMFKVECAFSGDEGFKKAQKLYPALILLDMKMPGADGYEILSRIRSDESLSDTPVIFMTGDTDSSREVEGFKAGVSDFVYKPFPPEVLVHRVKRLIDHSRLQKYLQHEVALQTEKAGHLSKEIMMALSAAVDAKDHYTNGHSQRVARYSADIARRMGKTRFEQEEIFVLGLMHDVGKIGVHEEIINKTSSLTDDEYDEMKKHTEIGYEILKKITEMPRLATGARWHHERYDGSGYPDGLKGDEIPEEARIICVADSYDAMTSKRSYSSPREQRAVRDEIERCKGKQFDPAIADVLIQMIDEDIDYQMSERGSKDGTRKG